MRRLREALDLTLKEVEARSRRIALSRGQKEFILTAGRLSQVETSNSTPSIYKLASLSQVYQTPYVDLLRIYGIEVGPVPVSLPGGGQKAEEPALALTANRAS